MKPKIHFLHANGFPGGSYKKLFGYLEDEYDVLYMDKIGHNIHFPVNEHWHNLSYELIDYLERTTDDRVIGVGHSLGAIVTFMAAYHRPDLFRGLVMLDPPLINGLGASVFTLAKWFGFMDKITPAAKTQGRTQQWKSFDDALSYFRSKALFNDWDADCLRDYISYGSVYTQGNLQLDYDVAIEVEIFRTTPTNSYRYREPLSLPGAIVLGETSDVSYPMFAKRLSKKHDFKMYKMEGGHMFPFQYPQDTAEEIKAAIKGFSCK